MATARMETRLERVVQEVEVPTGAMTLTLDRDEQALVFDVLYRLLTSYQIPHDEVEQRARNVRQSIQEAMQKARPSLTHERTYEFCVTGNSTWASAPPIKWREWRKS